MADVTALLIPAEDTEPARRHNIDINDCQSWARLCDAEWLDILNIHARPGEHFRATIGVDDMGLYKGLRLNRRASILTRRALVGNAIVFGVDPGGETVDIPQDVIDWVEAL